MQRDVVRPDRTLCDMELVVLPDGPVFRINQDRGEAARGGQTEAGRADEGIEREEVEGDVGRRDLLGQHAHAAVGGMDPLLVLRDLSEVCSEFACATYVSQVPHLDALDPARCFLR